MKLIDSLSANGSPKSAHLCLWERRQGHNISHKDRGGIVEPVVNARLVYIVERRHYHNLNHEERDGTEEPVANASLECHETTGFF